MKANGNRNGGGRASKRRAQKKGASVQRSGSTHAPTILAESLIQQIDLVRNRLTGLAGMIDEMPAVSGEDAMAAVSSGKRLALHALLGEALARVTPGSDLERCVGNVVELLGLDAKRLRSAFESIEGKPVPAALPHPHGTVPFSDVVALLALQQEFMDGHAGEDAAMSSMAVWLHNRGNDTEVARATLAIAPVVAQAWDRLREAGESVRY